MNKTILVVGAGGGVGFTCVKYFLAAGYNIISIDNNMRQFFFGQDGDVSIKFEFLKRNTKFFEYNICNNADMSFVFAKNKIDYIIHAAGQPSHDFPVSVTNGVYVDFEINTYATLRLLELTRQHYIDAPFLFLSTNKVYGDTPNNIQLKVDGRRFVFNDERFKNGINETMSIDNSMHSLFGVSKCAADLYVQEYARYFGMKTACFRCCCLTGAEHAGSQAHGFLNYIIRSAVENR
ncbi:MAG: NAD-dependent epimerase/dehydratase family protein, partial [Nanoarchaeota archaeon]